MLGKYLKNHKKLHALVKVLRAEETNDLIERVLDEDIDRYNLTIRQLGKNNKDKIIYVIKRKDKNEGFFAMLRTTLYYLALADRFGFAPYIRWSEECAYYQSNGYEGRENPFEYYFKQPVGLTADSVYNSFNVIFSKEADTKILSEFPLILPYYHDEKFIELMAYIVKKYIFFQDTIEAKLKEDTIPLLGKEKILGIHYRGTDFKVNYDAHPRYILESDYYSIIDSAINNYGMTKIFVATDDKKALERFTAKYGNRIVYFKDVVRGDGNISVMHSQKSRKNNNFLKGYEVLRDMYMLSMVDGIISGISMVSIFSRIFKRNTNQTYEVDIYIDKGINHNHNKYITCK